MYVSIKHKRLYKVHKLFVQFLKNNHSIRAQTEELEYRQKIINLKCLTPTSINEESILDWQVDLDRDKRVDGLNNSWTDNI